MIIPIVAFLLILGLLVFVHELGHFFVARKFGVRSEEFGLGFPPRIAGFQKDKDGKLKFFWRHKAPSEEQVQDPETGKPAYINKGDTIYSLNLIPLGGFVKIKGEMGENIDDEDSFANKTAGKRSLILVSGVTMNVVLSIVLIFLGLIIGLPQIVDEETPATARVRDVKIQIERVQADSPADRSGLKMGDTLLSVDNFEFTNIAEMQQYIDGKKGQEIEVAVRPINTDKTTGSNEVSVKKITVASMLEVFPESKKEESAKGVIGIGLVKTGIVSFAWYEAIWRSFVVTGSLLRAMIEAFFDLFKNLIVHQQVSGDLAGPVGIAIITKEMTKLGFSYVIQFAAVLSINLAIINILPIPALDGGRILFILIEKIRRRPMNQELEAKIHNAVFVLLLIMIALVTYRDVARIF